MRVTKLLSIAAAATFFANAPVQAQSEEGALRIHVLAGLQNQPGGFDVFRPVEYDTGKLIGGGVALQLRRNFLVRADFSYAAAGGQESGAINEGVDLNRSYYGAALEFRIPLGAGITPFILGGGGMVNLRREAPSYNFDLTESGAQVGGGVAYELSNAPVSIFVQVTEWIYSKTSAGGTQYDTSVGLGLAYRLAF